MPPSLIIKKLIQYGYLPNGAHKLDDLRVVDAIEKYRDFNQLYTLSTESLFKIPRCGYPDIVPDSTGSGSWPKGCHPEYLNNHAFAVYFDLAGMPSHWKPAFDQAWSLVQQAYANIGMAFFRVFERSKANSIVTWQRGSGWIGLAIVPRGPKCGQTIWAKYDTRYGASFPLQRLIWQLAFLMAHEFGHNMGTSHTRGGIMNPSLINGTFYPDQWRRNDPLLPTLTRWFGGVPITPSPPEWSIYPLPQE